MTQPNAGLQQMALNRLAPCLRDDMAWTTPPFRADVIMAGDVLRTSIPTDRIDEAAAHFRTAHDWRASHLLPLHSLRLSLHQQARAVAAEAVVAGRIKRMASIRKKLQRSRINLWDIQDIAGVRAVMPDMAAVEAVIGRFQDGRSRHKVAKIDNHIGSPKASGYRSAHLMMRYHGDEEAFRNRAVEIQIRTQLQHAWATALEAVGFMRGEDMKAGVGSADWLRFFVLMSAEIATYEGLPIPSGAPDDAKERLEEIAELEERVEAIKTLESYRSAIDHLHQGARSYSGRYVITLDRSAMRVTVKPLNNLDTILMGITAAEGTGSDSVVVEADSVQGLIAAYPNYFMDVGSFVDQIRRALGRASVGKPYLTWLRYWKWRPV